MPGTLKGCHLQENLVFLTAKIWRAFAKEKIQKESIPSSMGFLNSNPVAFLKGGVIKSG